MEEQATGRRRISKPQLVLGVLILGIFIGAAWFFTSGGFHDWVRNRVVGIIEEDTGGRTTIERIDWNFSKLELVFYGVTIHGREGPSEAPFAAIERLYMRARILSVLGRKMRLAYVEADHPVLHLITYPDGSTNQPAPRRRHAGSPVEALFDLQLDRAEIHNGVLLINNDAIPIDGTAEGLRAALDFAPPSDSFEGSADIEKLDARYHNLRPFAVSLHTRFTLRRAELEIHALSLSSGRSTLAATGRIANFADPHLALSFHGTLDLLQAAAVTRTPGFRAGTVQ
ncbi:MAG: hypothetical protein JO041_04000, partial [Acidobacteria bacterium]|nr:hypothetical protein [Acidobacteriota bacterium]